MILLKILKNLARYRFENNFVESIKIIIVERLSIVDNATKSFNILSTSLNILHNYFNDPKQN